MLQDRLGYRLKRTQQALRGAFTAALAALGLTTQQFVALAMLDETPDLSNAELARRSFVAPQSMIRVMASLEAAGLVERHGCGRGRVLQARVTRAGARKLRDAHRVVDELEGRIFGCLSTTDQEWLRKVIDDLALAAQTCSLGGEACESEWETST